MTDKLRVGIVGADANGQGWAPIAHFPALRALPEYEIAALCTTREETARAASARYGVADAMHDYRAFCARPDLDVIAVVVRAPNHYEVAMAALGAGKHVYCEWPLAATTAQAEAMAALARQQGVRNVVGLQARCDPTLRYVRDLVAQGFIGEVLAVDMVMLTTGAPERPSSKLWETKESGGISALTVRGIHSLDALCFCVGEFAELSARLATRIPQWRVTDTGALADVEVPDNVLVQGRLVDGAVVGAHIATLPAATPGFRMEIHGREGTLHVATGGAPQRDANRLTGAQGKAPPAPIEVPASYREVPPETPAGPPNNVAHLYRRLAIAIREGKPAAPDFDAGLARHHFMDAIRRSASEGRVVTLPA
jgi:predicted dehydrogenase